MIANLIFPYKGVHGKLLQMAGHMLLPIPRTLETQIADLLGLTVLGNANSHGPVPEVMERRGVGRHAVLVDHMGLERFLILIGLMSARVAPEAPSVVFLLMFNPLIHIFEELVGRTAMGISTDIGLQVIDDMLPVKG